MSSTDQSSDQVELVANDERGVLDPATRLATAVARGVLAGGMALIERRQAVASEVMNVDEAAAFLGLDRNTVYDAAGRNEIPHQRIGKRILLSRTQLVAWLGACKAARVGNG